MDTGREMPAFDAPEIEAADLAPLALELAVWGIADPASLMLMTPPPAAALAQARALLRQLEAIDAGNLATPHGRRMAELGVHPRLAHMMVRAEERGLGCGRTPLGSQRTRARRHTAKMGCVQISERTFRPATSRRRARLAPRQGQRPSNRRSCRRASA